MPCENANYLDSRTRGGGEAGAKTGAYLIEEKGGLKFNINWLVGKKENEVSHDLPNSFRDGAHGDYGGGALVLSH